MDTFTLNESCKFNAIRYEKNKNLEDGYILKINDTFYSKEAIDDYLKYDDNDEETRLANFYCGCLDLKQHLSDPDNLIPAIECMDVPREIKEGQWIVTSSIGLKFILDDCQFKKLFNKCNK